MRSTPVSRYKTTGYSLFRAIKTRNLIENVGAYICHQTLRNAKKTDLASSQTAITWICYTENHPGSSLVGSVLTARPGHDGGHGLTTPAQPWLESNHQWRGFLSGAIHLFFLPSGQLPPPKLRTYTRSFSLRLPTVTDKCSVGASNNVSGPFVH